MSVRAAKRFNIKNLGYFIDKPEPVAGGYERAITVLSGVSDVRYTGASFANDDWFKYIAGLTTHRSVFIATKPVKTVGRCLTANTRLDDDLIRRYGFRELLPELLLDYRELGETAGTELLNDALADIAKEIFETKRESYIRIYDLINAEYEPLYNLDVTYEEQHSGTDTEGIDTTTDAAREKDGSDSYGKTGTETTAYTGSETTADNEGSKNTTNNSTYAFNSAEPVPESKSVVDFDKSETKTFNGRNDATTYNTTDTTSYGSIDTEEITANTDRSFTHGEKIQTRRYGNQGVTRSDELVRAELDLRTHLDFIHLITDELAKQISII